MYRKEGWKPEGDLWKFLCASEALAGQAAKQAT
jgi:hypothetical protein